MICQANSNDLYILLIWPEIPAKDVFCKTTLRSCQIKSISFLTRFLNMIFKGIFCSSPDTITSSKDLRALGIVFLRHWTVTMYYIKLVVVEMQDNFLGIVVQIQVPGFVRVLIFFLNTPKN